MAMLVLLLENLSGRPESNRHIRLWRRACYRYATPAPFSCSHEGHAMKKSEKRQPREVRVKPATYQPSRAELREGFDMPGWSLDQMRERLLGPVKLVQDENASR